MSKHSFSAVVGIVAIVAIGRAAGAQDTTAIVIGDRAANAQIEQIVQSTKAQGLPVDPILAKVRYAVLVAHASPQLTVAAARGVAMRLPIAREALAPRDIPADIIAGEAALSFKVPKETLRDIRNASHEPSIAVPLGALTTLVAAGVPVKKASDNVLALIRRGASGQQLASLDENVMRDVASGVRVENALSLRVTGLNAVLSPSSGTVAGDAVVSAPQALQGTSAAPPAPPRKRP